MTDFLERVDPELNMARAELNGYGTYLCGARGRCRIGGKMRCWTLSAIRTIPFGARTLMSRRQC